MYGIWLLILFVILPAAAGAALAYVVSRAEQPSRTTLVIGAGIGVAIGIALGILLTRL